MVWKSENKVLSCHPLGAPPLQLLEDPLRGLRVGVAECLGFFALFVGTLGQWNSRGLHRAVELHREFVQDGLEGRARPNLFTHLDIGLEGLLQWNQFLLGLPRREIKSCLLICNHSWWLENRLGVCGARLPRLHRPQGPELA